MSKTLLDVKNLEIQYITEEGVVHAVNGVSFSLEKGCSMGLVGETGAGKTTTCLGILNLIARTTGRVSHGEICFEGEDLLKKSDREMQKIRGEKIAMIFQDPMTSLNPTMTIGRQIMENIRQHQKCSKREAYQRMLDMLKKVNIAEERADDYPHQFSGGMKQRVVIAMALACNPSLLLADEPTSALDVTIQAQVLEMIKALQEEYQTAMLLITHDLGVVAEVCSTVAIMYAGEIIEYGSVREVFRDPRHPYTRGLFAAIPRLDEDVDRLQVIPGMMPDPMELPQGCKFHPRCPYATEKCKTENPQTARLTSGHIVRCHNFGLLPDFASPQKKAGVN